MTRLVIRLCVLLLGSLFIMVEIFPMLGENSPAHLLVFNAIDDYEGVQSIRVVHVERQLFFTVTQVSARDDEFRITVDGKCLVFHSDTGSNSQFALVDLRTWEISLFPELETEAVFESVRWQTECYHIWLNTYGD